MKLQGSVEKVVIALCLYMNYTQQSFQIKVCTATIVFKDYTMLRGAETTPVYNLKVIKTFLPFCTLPNRDQTPVCNSMSAPPATTLRSKFAWYLSFSADPRVSPDVYAVVSHEDCSCLWVCFHLRLRCPNLDLLLAKFNSKM